jgi:Trk-type K+ transport system membrane component
VNQSKVINNKKLRLYIRRAIYLLIIFCAIAAFGISLFEFGFSYSKVSGASLSAMDRTINMILGLALPIYLLMVFKDIDHIIPRAVYVVCSIVFLFAGLNYMTGYGLSNMLEIDTVNISNLSKICVIALLTLEISRNLVWLNHLNLGPGKVLMLVFMVLITIGTLLLLLPNCSTSGLSLPDAFFMSVSAVCITGLSTIDISTQLTQTGQIVLMVLFQLGGLGIMTLTSFFAFFFKGGTSYQNQLYLKDFIQSTQLNNLFALLLKILGITLSIEAVGAVFFYFYMDTQLYPSMGQRVYYSIFHSISSFCNSGFTLFRDSLHTEHIRFNYGFISISIVLFILGSLGFGLMDNYRIYFKKLVQKYYQKFVHQEKVKMPSLSISINSRMIIQTSFILLFVGFLSIFFLEYNNTLAEFDHIGRLLASIFTSATPRSAGLNMLDTASLGVPTLIIIVFLMWVGGAPGSTAGGIKVTTFTVAILNIASLARSKPRTEYRGREISEVSIQRAFAVIVLSIVVISLSVFILTLTETNAEIFPIVFETVSAYCTVGLSMGLTPDLSVAGKIILSFCMFIGRLGAMTILVSVIRHVRMQDYRYPKEDIFIN